MQVENKYKQNNVDIHFQMAVFVIPEEAAVHYGEKLSIHSNEI